MLGTTADATQIFPSKTHAAAAAALSCSEQAYARVKLGGTSVHTMALLL